MLRLLVISTLAILTAACSEAPPADRRAADEAAIRQLIADSDAGFAARDYDKFLNMYADDAVIFFPDSKIVQGRAAFRQIAEASLGDPSVKMEINPTHVVVARSGELAYAYGAGVMHFADPATNAGMVQYSKWVTVFEKKADGTWKASADIFNNDGPPAPAE